MRRAVRTIIITRPPRTSDWPTLARKAIRAVHDTLPPGTSLAARMAAIDAAYPFGERRHYPYKIWCRERRRYLIPYGYVPQNHAAGPGPVDGYLSKQAQENEP